MSRSLKISKVTLGVADLIVAIPRRVLKVKGQTTPGQRRGVRIVKHGSSWKEYFILSSIANTKKLLQSAALLQHLSNQQADAHSYKADAHSYKADAHSYEADAHSYKADAHSYKADAHSYEADAHSHEADAHCCCFTEGLAKRPRLQSIL